MKRFVISLLIVLLFASNVFAVEGESLFEGSFSDVSNGHSNFLTINFLHDIDIVHGHPDGTFRPQDTINRAELIKMVVEMDEFVDPAGEDCFPDVTDQWFAPYVCAAEAEGWVNGYEDGFFRPDQPVNRVEAIKMVMNSYMEGEENVSSMANYADGFPIIDVVADEWYYDFVVAAWMYDSLDIQHVVGNSDDTYSYDPAGEMTREEVAHMLAYLLFQAEAYPEELALFTDHYHLFEVYPSLYSLTAIDVFDLDQEDFVVEFPVEPEVFYGEVGGHAQFDFTDSMKFFVYEEDIEATYILSYVDTGLDLSEYGDRAFEMVKWGTVAEGEMIEFVTEMKELDYNGNRGIDYRIEDLGDKEYFAFRSIFVEDRFYQLMYIDEAYGEYPGPEANAFLDSFQLK